MAEAWRNLTAVGAHPLAVTDNLNFGNPERPEIMGQLVGAIHGIAEACRALDFPVVSGNVSLYNETNGRGILPTPSIGGVGLVEDFAKSASLAFKAPDEQILLLGETTGWLGQSVYLRDICGREEGAPPPVDLAAEKRNGDLVRALIAEGIATAVHDVSDGGLADRARRDGDRLRHRRAALHAAATMMPAHAFWFGEDQARYVVTVRAEHADASPGARQGGRRAAAPARPDVGQRAAVAGRATDPGEDACRALRGLAAELYGGQRNVIGGPYRAAIIACA